jgi:hypothetical protein
VSPGEGAAARAARPAVAADAGARFAAGTEEPAAAAGARPSEEACELLEEWSRFGPGLRLGGKKRKRGTVL